MSTEHTNNDDNQKVDQIVSVQTKTTADGQVSHSNRFPLPLILLFFVISFLAGLTISVWYFQMELQKITGQKEAAQTAFAKPKVLIIGTDATDPPMESMNKQGDIIGFDIDLGYRIANEIGVKAEFKNISWDDIFKNLDDKKIDMIISSVTITDEREQKYDFSQPYINAGQVIISRKNNPIVSTDGLRGRKILVEKGTTNEQQALKFTSPNLVISYDNLVLATKALAEGKGDAMVSDLTLANGLIKPYDNLIISSQPFTAEYYGIVFRKDEQDLRKQVNDALDVLQVKGTISDLKQKWLE